MRLALNVAHRTRLDLKLERDLAGGDLHMHRPIAGPLRLLAEVVNFKEFYSAAPKSLDEVVDRRIAVGDHAHAEEIANFPCRAAGEFLFDTAPFFQPRAVEFHPVNRLSQRTEVLLDARFRRTQSTVYCLEIIGGVHDQPARLGLDPETT